MLSRIIGQDHAKRLMASAIRNDRLAHAYLFAGQEGWGAEEFALELARVMLCKEPGDFEPCGHCASCRKIMHFQHPDVHYAFPVMKSTDEADIRALLDSKAEVLYSPVAVTGGSIHIGDPDHPEKMSIRGLAREVSLRSYEGNRKIFILTHVENMNDEAANALLKVLEEPPAHAFFLLTSSQPQALLPTIMSRCQVIRLTRPRDADIAAALEKWDRIPSADALKLARLADGRYFRALQLQSGDLQESREHMLNFLRTALGPTPSAIGGFADQMIKQLDRDKTRILIILDLMTGWFADVACLRHRSGESLLVNFDIRDRIEKFTQHFPNADPGEALAAVEKAMDHIGRNVYVPLALVDLGIALRRCVIGHPDAA